MPPWYVDTGYVSPPPGALPITPDMVRLVPVMTLKFCMRPVPPVPHCDAIYIAAAYVPALPVPTSSSRRARPQRVRYAGVGGGDHLGAITHGQAADIV